MNVPEDKGSGVYAIINVTNGKRYVGSAECLQRRAASHRDCLNGGRHQNVYLQRAWDRSGEDAFQFVILEHCPVEECVPREQHWMDHYKAFGGGYNLNPTAGSRLGSVLSDESKRKISESKKGTRASDATRAKMSEARRGRPKSPEAIEKLKECHWARGDKAREVAEKIAAANRGQTRPMSTRKAISEAKKRNNRLRRKARLASLTEAVERAAAGGEPRSLFDPE